MKRNKLYLWGIIIFVTVIILSTIISNASTKKQEYDYFNSIGVSDYLKLFNGSEDSYIYIGKTSCGYCQQINPVLHQIVDETGIVINYINLEKISQSDYNVLVNSNDVLKGDWGTPTLLIVKEGKVVDSQIGYKDYAATKSFLLQEE
jgi:predicted bacteriocin transport accessory protein